MAKRWPSIIWMGNRRNRRCAPAARLLSIAAAAAAALGGWIAPTLACPFCTAVRPSWAQQREAADVFALATLPGAGAVANQARVLRVVRGHATGQPTTVPLAEPVAVEFPGRLALLMGRRQEGLASGADHWTWTALHVSEACLDYVARAPDLRTPTPERLAWFAKYLEHAEPLLAEDAYLEFASAAYDAVAAVADRLPYDQLRQWLVDPQVPAERKGLYGLLLGLAPDKELRAAHAAFLQEQIVTPACDFRSGFDGVLGGYLVCAGRAGLGLIAERFLNDPTAAEGDVRHALTALRFYQEFGREIPPPEVASAAALLLKRASTAAPVIVDLARWEHWSALDRVAALYDAADYPQPATRRAVVGYLLSAPPELAQSALDVLRRRDPQGVADAEEAFDRPVLAK